MSNAAVPKVNAVHYRSKLAHCERQTERSSACYVIVRISSAFVAILKFELFP